MKKLVLGLVALGAGSTSTAWSQEQCNTGVPIVNTVVSDAQPPGKLQEWEDWLDAADVYYLEGGIEGIPTATSSPLNKYILAVVLTHYGVKGAPPVPEQVLGTWSFSTPANRMIAHRGLDEYAAVTYGRGGAWAWNQILADGSLARGTNMHSGHRTRMNPGRAPWAANGFDWTFDDRPERRIDFACEAFSRPAIGILGTDAVGLAGIHVHEAIHSSGARHQTSPVDLCQDSPGASVCDLFIANPRPSPKGGIVGRVVTVPPFTRTSISVGSNQGGAEFLCDVAASPDDWVPVMASLSAQGLFQSMAEISRWINVKTLPFACGPKEALLRQAGYGQCQPPGAFFVPSVCRPELGAADCVGAAGQTCEIPDGVCSNNPSVACSMHGECQNSLSDIGATCEANFPDPPTCSFGICTNGTCTDPAGQCQGEGQCCVVVK